MQQTETYKLNLIETSDPFSPQALNENTQKIEEVVSEKLGEMDARVTVLEGKRIVLLVYTGDGTQNRVIQLGFTPTGVIYFSAFNGVIAFLSPSDKPGTIPGIVEGGVLVPNKEVNYPYNAKGREYRMICFC